MAMEQAYPLNKIVFDPAFQFRAEPYDQATIDRYAEQMTVGDDFPAIVLWHVSGSGTVYCLDGWQRSAAAEKIGRDSIKAIFKTLPNRSDALMFAAAANTKHGKHLESGEIEAMLKKLLADPDCGKRSDRYIAENCHVSPSTVGAWRRKLSGVQTGQVDERIGKDGKTYTVKPKPEPRPVGVDGKEIAVGKWVICVTGGAFGCVTAIEDGRVTTARRADGSGVPITWAITDVRALSDAEAEQILAERDAQNARIKQMNEEQARQKKQKPTPPDNTAAIATLQAREGVKVEAPTGAENATPEPPAIPENAPGVTVGYPRDLTLAEGDMVRNIHSGVIGTITGFVGGAAQVESDNGVRAVKKAYLERIEPIEANANGFSTLVIKPDAPPTGPKGDSETPAPDSALSAQHSALSTSTIDNLTPRPWHVTKTPAGYLIADQRGHTVATVATSDTAYFIARAANAYREYKSPESKEIEMPLRRINDYFEGGPLEAEQMTEDVYTVMDSLGHLRRTLAKNQPAAEAVVP